MVMAQILNYVTYKNIFIFIWLWPVCVFNIIFSSFYSGAIANYGWHHSYLSSIDIIIIIIIYMTPIPETNFFPCDGKRAVLTVLKRYIPGSQMAILPGWKIFSVLGVKWIYIKKNYIPESLLSIWILFWKWNMVNIKNFFLR